MDMNKNDILKYALIAGGAYAVYWYVTNYGPTGAVSAGSVSYWNTWFGTQATPPPATTTTLTPAQQQAAALAAAQAACVAPSTWNNSTGVCTPQQQQQQQQGGGGGGTTTYTTYAQLRNAILSTAGITNTTNPANVLTVDQWNYYQNIARPPALTGTQFSSVLNSLTAAGLTRTSNITIDQFMSALQASGVLSGLSGIGMGDVVPSYSRPSVPMMSFGGNAFSSPFKN